MFSTGLTFFSIHLNWFPQMFISIPFVENRNERIDVDEISSYKLLTAKSNHFSPSA
jgi:hypothetical protein